MLETCNDVSCEEEVDLFQCLLIKPSQNPRVEIRGDTIVTGEEGERSDNQSDQPMEAADADCTLLGSWSVQAWAQ